MKKSFGWVLGFLLAACLCPAAPELVNVPFALGASDFKDGDEIFLQQVLATSPNLGVGDRVVVRGQYRLASRKIGVIGLHLSGSAGGSRPEGVTKSQKKEIKDGSGTFELSYEIKRPGTLHVSFYSISEGRRFGGVYFGPGAPGQEAASAPAAAPEIAAAQASVSDSPGAAAVVSPARMPPAADASVAAAPEVSLLQIVATPERFDGRRVAVSGYALIEFGAQWIFPSRELAISPANGIWIDRDFANLGAGQQLMKFVPVRIEGVFEADTTGQQGKGSGSLRQITRFETLPMP